MIKLDYDAVGLVRRRHQGPRGDQPAGDRQGAHRQIRGRGQVPRLHQEGRRRPSARPSKAAVPSAVIGQSFQTVYGGISAIDPGERAPRTSSRSTASLPSSTTTCDQPLTDSSPDFIGATPLYGGLGGAPNAGSGVIYGNLDTGVWPEHPSFADQGNLGAPPPKADGTPRTCNFGDNPLTPATDVVRLQRQAHRRAAVPGDLPVQPGPRGGGAVSTRPATRTATARTRRRRRPATCSPRRRSSASSAARSTASPRAPG